MAKIKNVKPVINVSGLSTKDILNMDVYKLNKQSLKAVVNRLISSANKRLRRLEKKASSSPALRQHYDYTTKQLQQFTLKGAKTRNEVESVMKRVKSFLEAKTSTIKGFKEYAQDVKVQLGDFESKQQANEFWKTYNDWIKTHPELYNLHGDTNGLVEMFYDNYVVKGKTSRGTKSAITRALRKMHIDINLQQQMEEEMMMNDLKPEDAFRIKKDF